MHEDPSSKSWTERSAALSALCILALQAAVLPTDAPRTAWGITLAAVVLAAGSFHKTLDRARTLCVLVACLSLGMRVGLLWQLAMTTALTAHFLLGRFIPSLRPAQGWWQRGNVPLGWTALVGGVTPGALLAWQLLVHPDLGDVTHSSMMAHPVAVLIAGGILFAVVNATLEELIWRGVVQNTTMTLWHKPVAIALQALSFGAQHAHGIPRGILGMTLAGSWAVMLGILRAHTQGLLAPILAHIVADATIAVIVIGLVT